MVPLGIVAVDPVCTSVHNRTAAVGTPHAPIEPLFSFFLFIVQYYLRETKAGRTALKHTAQNDCMDSSSLPAIIFIACVVVGLAQCATVTISCSSPGRRSLTPYHRRIESLNANSCYAYSIAEKCRKVKVYQRCPNFAKNTANFPCFSLSDSVGGIWFLVFLVIRRLIFTLFPENLHDDQPVLIAMTIPPAKRMICSVGMPDAAFHLRRVLLCCGRSLRPVC